MVRLLVDKITPGRGFAHAFHVSFQALLPPVLLVLVYLGFNLLALVVLLLSKWRMFALHPRHWLAHIRTNAVDIIVGLSFLALIIESSFLILQLIWVILFELWLLVLKPRSDTAAVAAQGVLAQGFGLGTVLLAIPEANRLLIVISFWLITYFSARHFFNAFEEPRAHLLSAIWAFFAAALAWVLSHWLLFVGPIAQPALIVTVLAIGFATMYYLDSAGRLGSIVRRQILMTLLAVLFVIIIFSDWGDKTV